MREKPGTSNFLEIMREAGFFVLAVPALILTSPFIPVFWNFGLMNAPGWDKLPLKFQTECNTTLGWNTFPVPLLTEQNKADLTTCAENILLARETHFPATIADLYDPDTMPVNLKRAHARNDEVLERIYIGRRFKNDTERLEKLFELYTKTTAGSAKPGPGKGRKMTAL